MSNSSIREHKRCIGSFILHCTQRLSLFVIFLHKKGGYGGVDKHYAMGIESGIQQLTLYIDIRRLRSVYKIGRQGNTRLPITETIHSAFCK